MTGMASVAAARAEQAATTNIIVDRTKQVQSRPDKLTPKLLPLIDYIKMEYPEPLT